jgi:hypothetical protein
LPGGSSSSNAEEGDDPLFRRLLPGLLNNFNSNTSRDAVCSSCDTSQWGLARVYGDAPRNYGTLELQAERLPLSKPSEKIAGLPRLPSALRFWTSTSASPKSPSCQAKICDVPGSQAKPGPTRKAGRGGRDLDEVVGEASALLARKRCAPDTEGSDSRWTSRTPRRPTFHAGSPGADFGRLPQRLGASGGLLRHRSFEIHPFRNGAIQPRRCATAASATPRRVAQST